MRRIWCVGRNYVEHIREMGQDERLPPFYFAKPADAIVPEGGTVPYPSLTKVANAITGAHWSGPCFFGLARNASSRTGGGDRDG